MLTASAARRRERERRRAAGLSQPGDVPPGYYGQRFREKLAGVGPYREPSPPPLPAPAPADVLARDAGVSRRA
jgi:hypothetical protein